MPRRRQSIKALKLTTAEERWLAWGLVNGPVTPSNYRDAWEATHGRIPRGWVIHHINGDRTDNRLANLMLCTRQQHRRLHPTYRGLIRELQ